MLLPLALVNYGVMNMGVQISFSVPASVLFEYIPRIRIAASYDSSFLNFLKNHHSVFHSSFTKVPISPMLAYTSFLFFFFE